MTGSLYSWYNSWYNGATQVHNAGDGGLVASITTFYAFCDDTKPMEDPSCLQPLSVKNLSPSVQSCLRRLDFQEETILESLDDGNAAFDPTRAHAYGGVDHSSGGVDFFVIRTDVELLKRK